MGEIHRWGFISVTDSINEIQGQTLSTTGRKNHMKSPVIMAICAYNSFFPCFQAEIYPNFCHSFSLLGMLLQRLGVTQQDITVCIAKHLLGKGSN